MSQENVEVVRRANAAFNRGDCEGSAECYDPEIECRDFAHAADAPETLKGAQALLSLLSEWRESFDDFGQGRRALKTRVLRVVVLEPRRLPRTCVFVARRGARPRVPLAAFARRLLCRLREKVHLEAGTQGATHLLIAVRCALHSRAGESNLYAKHGVLRCDPCELHQRGSGIHPDVCTRAGRELQVALEDRRPALGVHFLEAHRFTAAMAKGCLAAGGPHVGHPVRALPEHRNEVALALVVCDHDWKRHETPRAAAAHLERLHTVRRQPGRRSPRPHPIQESRHAIGSAASVHPPVEPVWHPDALSAHSYRLRTGRRGTDLLFGETATSPFYPEGLQRRADAAWKAAKLERITLHECRHTFASIAIAAGVNVGTVSAVLGHALVTITWDRYHHLMPGTMDQAADLIQSYIEGAV